MRLILVLTILQIRSRSMAVAWSVDSGSSVLVQYKPSFSHAWSNLSVASQLSKALVTMLIPGTKYDVRLIAVNEVGASLPSRSVQYTTAQEGKFHQRVI